MNANITISILSHLIATSADGQKGFAEAANDATLPLLKKALQQRSAECSNAAAELQSLVQSIGGSRQSTGPYTTLVRRRWFRAHSFFAKSNVAVFEEVERSEDHVKAIYEKALRCALPLPIREVVLRQHAGTIRNHYLIRKIRNSYRSSAT